MSNWAAPSSPALAVRYCSMLARNTCAAGQVCEVAASWGCQWALHCRQLWTRPINPGLSTHQLQADAPWRGGGGASDCPLRPAGCACQRAGLSRSSEAVSCWMRCTPQSQGGRAACLRALQQSPCPVGVQPQLLRGGGALVLGGGMAVLVRAALLGRGRLAQGVVVPRGCPVDPRGQDPVQLEGHGRALALEAVLRSRGPVVPAPCSGHPHACRPVQPSMLGTPGACCPVEQLHQCGLRHTPGHTAVPEGVARPHAATGSSRPAAAAPGAAP